MTKYKMRIMILKQLREDIISACDLAKKTKAKRNQDEFVKELNHLYNQDIIIPIYQDNQMYFMSR